MRKKFLRNILILVLLFFICEGIIVAVSSYFNSRNKEAGLKLSVKNVSSTGLTLTTERSQSEIPDELMVNYDYSIQRWTLFGWKSIETDYVSLAVLREESIEEGDSWTRELRWDNYYGKLSPGIYRVVEQARTYTSEKYAEEDGMMYEKKAVDKDFLIYATFVVFF